MTTAQPTSAMNRYRHRQHRRPRRHRPPHAYRAAAVRRQQLRFSCPGSTREPVGTLTISDTTPTEGRLADGLDCWRDGCGQCQREQSDRRDHRPDHLHLAGSSAIPGTGVFEDIIILPGGDLAFQSANGTTFRVTPDLAGLVAARKGHLLRMRMALPETCSPAPTAPVIDVPDAPPTTPAALAEPNAGGEGIHLAVSDLNFILDQIRVAEAPCRRRGSALAGAKRARCGRPAHRRWLVQQPGQFRRHQSDRVRRRRQRLPAPDRPGLPVGRAIAFDPDGPGPAVGTPTSYQQTSGLRLRLAAAHHLQPGRRSDRQQSCGLCHRL